MNLEKKEGYKQTKLGLIPEDWDVCTFIDIADKKVKWSITGGPFGSNLKAEHYKEEGIRIIQLQNIGDGEFRDTSKIYTSTDKADELIACNIFPNEIILSKMGDPVARACNIPDTEKRWLMGSDGIRLVVDESQYDKRFVLDYINYSTFRNLAISRSTGSTRRRIGLVDLKKIPFIKLPLPEQQKIANILNTWDKAIATQEKLITQKQALKKGLMQQLLTGNKRFAGFTEEWDEVKLGDLLTIRNGKDYKHLEYGNIPVYGTGGIMTYVDDFLYEGESVGIGRKGTIDKPVYLNGKFWTVDTLFYCNSFENCIPKYIYYLFQTINWKRYNEASGVPSLSQATIKNIKVIAPGIPEQAIILKILSNVDENINCLIRKIHNLKKQKKGLMQQLLTGEKRVKI